MWTVQRLCYVGRRGMGALEYEPATLAPPGSRRAVEVASLVDLANRILEERGGLGGVFAGVDDREAVNDLPRVGTSAGERGRRRYWHGIRRRTSSDRAS
jgi:serine/threonine-protein kinase HipA